MPHNYPLTTLLHIPHDSTTIPASLRDHFVLDDAELRTELIRMTDHLTHAIFAAEESSPKVIRAPVSRLVVDVERFREDAQEREMAAKGMGAVYTKSSHGIPLRRPLSKAERDSLLYEYYDTHHARLTSAVERTLASHDTCIVLDCHSFPSVALPYEDAKHARPDICIGTDDFHTSMALQEAFIAAFIATGWQVKLNQPFAGALVPSKYYNKDKRVGAIMVEINRSLYLNEATGLPLPDFEATATKIRDCCRVALTYVEQHRRMATLPEWLVEAYKETRFIVSDLTQTITLRHDHASPALDDLLSSMGYRSWAFVSAWNPYSEELPKELNDIRHSQLCDLMNTTGMKYYEGEGVGAKETWRERSLLVAGITLHAAESLGSQFGQNAILFGEIGKQAELVFCERPPRKE